MNGDTIDFLPKLTSGQEFDEVRLENPLEVYANEVEPLGALITDARPYINQAPLVTPRALADLRFNDQMLALAWDKQLFSRPRHAQINQQETATMSHDPFLLVAPRQRRVGVLLIHGLLASPAEVRGIGENCMRWVTRSWSAAEGHGTCRGLARAPLGGLAGVRCGKATRCCRRSPTKSRW
ncbi:MAG: hypothetical protein H6978_01080 [Gammaproteobacteria bacterium]|nr:hypothetical protein [Gammaproteobacteria bacterium]